MCDSTNITNDLPLLSDGRSEMKRERRDSHRCSVSGRHLSLSAGKRPMNSRIEIAQRFQSARAHAADPPRSIPVDKALGDVFRRDFPNLNNRLAGRKCELRIVRDGPLSMFLKSKRTGLSFKWTTQRVANY